MILHKCQSSKTARIHKPTATTIPSCRAFANLFLIATCWVLVGSANLQPVWGQGHSPNRKLSQASITQELETLERRLFDLPDIRFKKVADVGGFPAYLLNVRQKVDHNDLAKGFFYQQVQLVHRGFDNPTVINTCGYNLNRRPNELFNLIDCNYVSVEHRYFGPSRPEIRDWDCLTIEQAAADYHHIRTLLGEIYAGDWVSTGVSKGGETCTYYRHFYPDDVVLSVPYVAPFPVSLNDPRFYDFFDNVGTEQCRNKIKQFQTNVLKHKKTIVPLFRYYLKGRNASVKMLGGAEAAIELFVLEYPFSFWQGGRQCESIPGDDASPEELLDHIIDSGDFWYLLDDSLDNHEAHYYQHATQLGYYGYQTSDFPGLIDCWKGEVSACFFDEKELPKFDPSTRDKLAEWLKTDARDFIFIYGAVDTWSVAQADIGSNTNVKKYMLEGLHHYNARIRNAPAETREEIIQLLQSKVQ